MKGFRALWLILIALQAIVAAPSRSEAASAAEINADADATLHSFVRQSGGAQELGNKAAGVLVFPTAKWRRGWDSNPPHNGFRLMLARAVQ
jgi:hypothetical protein